MDDPKHQRHYHPQLHCEWTITSSHKDMASIALKSSYQYWLPLAMEKQCYISFSHSLQSFQNVIMIAGIKSYWEIRDNHNGYIFLSLLISRPSPSAANAASALCLSLHSLASGLNQFLQGPHCNQNTISTTFLQKGRLETGQKLSKIVGKDPWGRGMSLPLQGLCLFSHI